MKFVKNRIVLFIAIVVLVLSAGGYLVYRVLFNGNESSPITIKVADKIEKYDYSLDERDTKLMKDEFNKLANILDTDEVDYDAYASSLAKLYIIDLYTIDNKMNIYDLPCLEYVYDQTDFKNKVTNTLYMYLKDNEDGKRKQELPEVKNVDTSNIKTTTFKVDNKEYDAFTIDVEWTYKKDLGYDNSCTLTMIKDQEKLYVVKQEIKDISSSS